MRKSRSRARSAYRSSDLTDDPERSRFDTLVRSAIPPYLVDSGRPQAVFDLFASRAEIDSAARVSGHPTHDELLEDAYLAHMRAATTRRWTWLPACVCRLFSPALGARKRLHLRSAAWAAAALTEIHFAAAGNWQVWLARAQAAYRAHRERSLWQRAVDSAAGLYLASPEVALRSDPLYLAVNYRAHPTYAAVLE